MVDERQADVLQHRLEVLNEKLAQLQQTMKSISCKCKSRAILCDLIHEVEVQIQKTQTEINAVRFD